MGCGCSKARAAGVVQAAESFVADAAAGRIAVFQVMVGGEVVTSTTSPTAARQEAKRLGGSLRVTSREATPAEATAVGLAPAPADA